MFLTPDALHLYQMDQTASLIAYYVLYSLFSREFSSASVDFDGHLHFCCRSHLFLKRIKLYDAVISTSLWCNLRGCHNLNNCPSSVVSAG